MLAIEHDPATTGEGWSGFAGNEKAATIVRELCADARKRGQSVAFLLDGESGIGKSLAARLATRHELGVDPRPAAGQLLVTASEQLTAEEFAKAETMFSAHALWERPWCVWIIEELDHQDSRQLKKLLTFLDADHFPPRAAVFMTTNVKVQKDSLFKDRRAAISEETEKALLGRAYPVHMFAEGLATRGGGIGPGAARVKTVAQRIGADGKPDSWYIKQFGECHGSIREAINRLATG